MPQRLPPDAEREGVRKMALTVSHRPYHKGLTLAAPGLAYTVKHIQKGLTLLTTVSMGLERRQ